MHKPDKLTQQADLAFVRQLMKEPMLDRDRERKLTDSWHQNHDEESLHQLIKSYTRLVISTALRFRHYGLPISDLIQEGNVGLLIAAKRFDPKRDVRFSTYAKWWIRSSIQDYVLKNWSIVRTGSTTSHKQLFFNLKRLRSKLVSVSFESMSEEDREKIATELKVSIDDVEIMENRLAFNDLSLDAPLGEIGDADWLSNLADDRPSPEMNVLDTNHHKTRDEWLEKALKCLSPRERSVILARRLTDNPLTLEELGARMQISKERVRQLELRAIRKLKFHLMDDKIQTVRDLI
ncbi:MAG TPA: RNA polymerase factor sigma-32 [Alphaproteobacteria bacterium]|nr:RNA polymerase factor sigma-32 [Alphaproteobacteria bacterium]